MVVKRFVNFNYFCLVIFLILMDLLLLFLFLVLFMEFFNGKISVFFREDKGEFFFRDLISLFGN